MKNLSWSLKNLFILVTVVGATMAIVAASFQGAVWVSGFWIALVIMVQVTVLGGILSAICNLFGFLNGMLIGNPQDSVNIGTHRPRSPEPLASPLGAAPIPAPNADSTALAGPVSETTQLDPPKQR